MNSIALLTGSHLRTYRKILQHPVARNLAWRDVHALFRHLGQVDVEPNANLKVTRNGQTLVLHPPRTKDVAEPGELIVLRHFIERSEAPQKTNGKVARWLVVIDRHEARIYRSAAPGAVPQLIRPYMSEESFCQAYSSKGFSRNEGMPDPGSFFEPVAGVLNGAGKILIFGGGTGASSEMNRFTDWLKRHRPELAKRIAGSLVVDVPHSTEDQLLAKARDFYANGGTE